MHIFRVKKYGAGDRIPRHRYGIYSKEWPIEREKIINETRTKLQTAFTKSQWEKALKIRKHSVSMDSITRPIKQYKSNKKILQNENVCYKDVSKMLLNIHSGDRCEKQNSKVKSGILVQPLLKNEAYKMENIEDENQMFVNRYSNDNRIQYRNISQGDKLNEKKTYWHTGKPF